MKYQFTCRAEGGVTHDQSFVTPNFGLGTDLMRSENSKPPDLLIRRRFRRVRLVFPNSVSPAQVGFAARLVSDPGS